MESYLQHPSGWTGAATLERHRPKRLVDSVSGGVVLTNTSLCGVRACRCLTLGGFHRSTNLTDTDRAAIISPSPGWTGTGIGG